MSSDEPISDEPISDEPISDEAGSDEVGSDEVVPPETEGRQPPEQTKDDTDVGWGEARDPEGARDEHERWLLEQRPPHWD